MKAEKENVRLLAEKAGASENRENAEIHLTYLSVDNLKSEKRYCQGLIASFHKL